MNHFKLHTTKNEEGQPVGPNEVYMHLSEFSEASNLGEQMRTAFEIEMMQGRQEPDAQGGTHYWFELSDEKMTMLRQWLMLAYFSPDAN
jgi:hypothetical protein